MKICERSFFLLAASMKMAMSLDSIVSNLRGNDNDIDSSTRKLVGRRQTKPCKLMVSAGSQVNGDDSEESFACELDPEDADGTSGQIIPFELSTEQEALMHSMLVNDVVTSGVSRLMNINNVITSSGTLFVPPGEEISFGRRQNDQRNLAIVTGDKPVLAVRVQATDYDVVDSAAVISDKIFGTSDDPNNLASQLNACSMNQLHLTTDYDNQDISNKLAADGVLSVSINIPLEGNDRYTVANAVTKEVQDILGFDLPGPFHHVMYIIKGCYPSACTWAAYAYINSWNSVYQGPYYKFTGVQIHELGHNLNLAHSGMGSATYTDHTCMMGNPLYSDNVGRMCFNPAKNWQIGWYNTHRLYHDPRVNNYWRGTIIGIADYLNNPHNHPVVIKIETGTNTDHFIGFNRATGVNADNDLCDDCVTVIETGNNGEAYSQSWNLVSGSGGLQQGQEYRFSDWQGLNDDLVIFVHEINLNTNPGFADVSISLGATPPPTSSPTSPPTVPPTQAPTSSPTVSPTPAPTSSPTTSAPTLPPTPAPTASPTEAPTPAPTFPPTPAPTASPTEAPTPSPTNSPTPAPTASPTEEPTPSPTNTPTEAPTYSPTNPPTKAPTTSPTPAPTLAPTDPPTTEPTKRSKNPKFIRFKK